MGILDRVLKQFELKDRESSPTPEPQANPAGDGSLKTGLTALSAPAPKIVETKPAAKKYVRTAEGEREAKMFRDWLKTDDVPPIDRKWLEANPQFWKEFVE